MLSFLKRMLTGLPIRKNFQFLIYSQGEKRELNRWYRQSHWQSPHYVRMDSEWSKDWKCFSSDEEVVGVSKEDRESKFLVLGDQPNFRVFLEHEPGNPNDKNAVKVMASATVDGVTMVGAKAKQALFSACTTFATSTGSVSLPLCAYGAVWRCQ